MTTRIARQNIGGRFVVFTMFKKRIGALFITREKDGFRFTIATMHSSTVLTDSQTKKLVEQMIKLFHKAENTTGV